MADRNRNAECYIYERDGTMYHAHHHPESGWTESPFTLRTLDHHTTMYHRQRFYATPTDLPDYVTDRLTTGEDTDDA